MIGAGRRNKKLTIQTPTVTNTYGEVVQSWSTLAVVWAAIEPLSSREALTAQQMLEVTTHRITIVYRDDVTANMQGTWNGRTFKFTAVLPDADEREMTIMAQETRAT